MFTVLESRSVSISPSFFSNCAPNFTVPIAAAPPTIAAIIYCMFRAVLLMASAVLAELFLILFKETVALLAEAPSRLFEAAPLSAAPDILFMSLESFLEVFDALFIEASNFVTPIDESALSSLTTDCAILSKFAANLSILPKDLWPNVVATDF